MTKKRRQEFDNYYRTSPLAGDDKIIGAERTENE